jgi:sensor histidine kinase YesM
MSTWALVCGAHFAVFYFVLNQSIYVSLADSILFNFSFALAGLALWYFVRYNDFEIKNLPELLFNHLVASGLIIAVWILIISLLLKSIFTNQDYAAFLNAGIAGRAIAGVFYYLSIILVFYLIIYYQENRDQQIRSAQLTSQLKEAELDTLKNQINPHFLFNSLNSISYLTLSDPEKAREIITKLSDFLRILLRENKHSKATLIREIEISRLYIDIEKSRFGDKLVYEEDIDEKSKPALVPPLIMLPLIENSIKHGVQDSTRPVKIKVNSKIIDKFLMLEISNTCDPGSNKKGEGLGLKNIRKRLDLMYDSQHMEIKRTKDLFSVTLTLPYNTNGTEN